jgi:hypothetical protein
LLAVAVLVLFLLLHVTLQLVLEILAQALNLARLESVQGRVGRAFRIRLERPDLIPNACVLELCLCHQRIELLLSATAVTARKSALVQRRDLLHIGAEATHLIARVCNLCQKVVLRHKMRGWRLSLAVGLTVGLHFVLFLLERGRHG